MADAEHREAQAGRRPALTGDDLAALSGLTGESPALCALRRAAASRYAAVADPDRVTHLWRFTDPAHLLPEAVQPSPSGAPHAAPHALGAAARVLMVAGLRPLIATDLKALAAGLVVKPLAEAEEELAALCDRRLADGAVAAASAPTPTLPAPPPETSTTTRVSSRRSTARPGTPASTWACRPERSWPIPCTW